MTNFHDPSLIDDMNHAVNHLRGRGTTEASATADLLEAIAADMEDNAFGRTAFAGTDAQHVTVWDKDGHRLDWTMALNLARTVIA